MTLSLGLLLSSYALAAGGKAMPLGPAKEAFSLAMAANQQDIASFLALSCVTDSGKAFVSGLSEGTSRTSQDVEGEYNDYMAFVTKPMQGNGKCDGGFQGVAAESFRRRQRTVRARQRIWAVQNAYRSQAAGNLFSPVITFNDSGGSGCMNEDDRLYGELEAGVKTVDDSLQQLQKSLGYEEERFRSYQSRNHALRLGCGELPDGRNVLVPSTPSTLGSAGRAPASAGPGGRSRNDASSITGIQEDAEKRVKAGLP